MTCALQQMDAAASKAPRSDLHSLALVFKEIAEAYQTPRLISIWVSLLTSGRLSYVPIFILSLSLTC